MASTADGGIRGLAKRVMLAVSIALVSPIYLLYRVNLLFLDREAAIQGLSQFLALLPGMPGTFARRGFYCLTLRRCSPDCTISFGTIFSTPECEIGSHVYIGAYCVISDCIIDDDTLLGSQVQVISGKHAHGFEDAGVPMRLQKTSRRAIHIGSNSWIGNGAIVMADVASGCVVGAGSVVTRDAPDNSIVAGNPARVIRNRTTIDSPPTNISRHRG
jgi:virginiamycin A acetyltransferase